MVKMTEFSSPSSDDLDGRVENLMQMWRNGALDARSATGAKSTTYILCRRVDMLTDANMKKLCYIEELWNRSLWQTLKDWWRWLPSRKS